MSRYIGPKLEAHEGWCSMGAPLVWEDDSPVIDEQTGEQQREQCTCGFEAQQSADRSTFVASPALDETRRRYRRGLS